MKKVKLDLTYSDFTCLHDYTWFDIFNLKHGMPFFKSIHIIMGYHIDRLHNRIEIKLNNINENNRGKHYSFTLKEHEAAALLLWISLLEEAGKITDEFSKAVFTLIKTKIEQSLT
jgi:hypothetical protein